MVVKVSIIIALAIYILPTECINIVNRAEWGAKSPNTPVPNIKTPRYVVIHHSTGRSCTNKNDCIRIIKNIQIDHITNRGFNDIGYNFLIGEDGNIYEGRGWGKLGSHAKGFNSKSIGICFIGTYTDSVPNSKALQAAKDLIQYGIDNTKIKDCYKLLGHRQTKQTACPGTALFNTIKSWSNWSENTNDNSCI